MYSRCSSLRRRETLGPPRPRDWPHTLHVTRLSGHWSQPHIITLFEQRTATPAAESEIIQSEFTICVTSSRCNSDVVDDVSWTRRQASRCLMRTCPLYLAQNQAFNQVLSTNKRDKTFLLKTWYSTYLEENLVTDFFYSIRGAKLFLNKTRATINLVLPLLFSKQKKAFNCRSTNVNAKW